MRQEQSVALHGALWSIFTLTVGEEQRLFIRVFSRVHISAAAYRPHRMQIYKRWFCLSKITRNKTSPKSTRELFVFETVETGNGATRC